jgi:hypothetical protein
MAAKKKKDKQVKFSFTEEQLELLKKAADGIPLVAWGRRLMLHEAGKLAGISKSRIRGNVSRDQVA